MWTYEQSTGDLYSPTGQLIASGYAGGNCGHNPEGVNNPSLDNIPCVGPLPCGIYTVEQPIDDPHLGPFALPLTPNPDNEMFGRSGFFCHGDLVNGPPHSASEGCIIMPRNIRNMLSTSKDNQIQVVATKS